MSVITTVEAVPNRFEVLLRYLELHNPVSDAELRAAVSPPSLRRTDQSNISARVINEAERLQFLEQDSDKKWHLKLRRGTSSSLRDVLEERLFDAETREATNQIHVGPAIAWFLTLDTAHPPSIGQSWGSLVKRSGLTETFDLANDASSTQFAYWVTYLGFGWRLNVGGGEVLVPDPAEALLHHLRRTLKPGKRTSLVEAMEAVAGSCPVLEGGAIRREVESQLATKREGRRLSRSTSVALKRLESRGHINLASASDGTTITLDLWPDSITTNYITLLKEAAR